jgi:hypothetical protein
MRHSAASVLDRRFIKLMFLKISDGDLGHYNLRSSASA